MVENMTLIEGDVYFVSTLRLDLVKSARSTEERIVIDVYERYKYSEDFFLAERQFANRNSYTGVAKITKDMFKKWKFKPVTGEQLETELYLIHDEEILDEFDSLIDQYEIENKIQGSSSFGMIALACIVGIGLVLVL
jgi:hypothetical protein